MLGGAQVGGGVASGQISSSAMPNPPAVAAELPVASTVAEERAAFARALLRRSASLVTPGVAVFLFYAGDVRSAVDGGGRAVERVAGPKLAPAALTS